MPWPKDPAKYAETLARHSAAQKARWVKPEARQAARERGLAQWTPEKRAEMSAIKRGHYIEDPTLRQRVIPPDRGAKARAAIPPDRGAKARAAIPPDRGAKARAAIPPDRGKKPNRTALIAAAVKRLKARRGS